MSYVIKDGFIIGDLFGTPVTTKIITRQNGAPRYKMPDYDRITLHTTEGLGIDNAWTTLNGRNPKHTKTAPNILLGDFRIYQLAKLDEQPSSLRQGISPNFLCNMWGGLQIEIVEVCSANKPWLPRDSSLTPLINFMAFANIELGIPLTRPDGWLNTLEDMHGEVLATGHNSRRKSRKFFDKSIKGYFQHLEVPYNDHYDCGKLMWRELFAIVERKIQEIKATTK